MPITLATLETATAQEVFNQVASHLLTQFEQSRGISAKSGFVKCLYRYTQQDGTVLKCAGGSLMSDEEASNISASDSWESLVVSGAVTSKHVQLVSDLQKLHDNFGPADWASNLRYIATENKLTTEVLSA